MVLKKKLRFQSTETVQDLCGKLIAGSRADVLFPEKPTLHFHPKEQGCPACGSSLQIQKTWIKEVVTMDIGSFRAKETVMMCPHNHATLVSGQLRNLVPEKALMVLT